MLIHGEITERVLGAAIEVHRCLGPGLLESAYRECLVEQLRSDGLEVSREVPLTINYKGLAIAGAYRVDLIVNELILLELKALERLLPIHEAQVLTYLKLSNLKVGLLINFNSTRLQHGIRRLVRRAPQLHALA